MKNRVFLLCLIAAVAVACIKDQQEVIQTDTDAPVFYAAIETLGKPMTRVFADTQLRVLWNADDRVSIFNKSTYNRQYRFDGQDGDNSGAFKLVPSDDFVTSNPLDCVYSVYPYNENTKISNDGEITVYLPAEQTYRENSFGLGANTMIAITQGDELMFKNLCGYFAVKLYGDNVSVSSISLKGNKDELLAGKATVVAQINASPVLQFDSSEATTELTLTFDTPIVLGSTAETATTFWFVIPPTTFDGGITLTVRDDQNESYVRTASETLEIRRNTLKKTTSLKVEIEHQTTPSDPSSAILFTDPIAKYACVEKYDTNNDGEVSYAEAEAVSSLSGLFTDWNTVTSFEEIRYFTGVTSTEEVFDNLTKLTHITIPDHITMLGSFKNCSSLKTVVLPKTLMSLPPYCFDGCTVLSDISLPTEVTTIPDYCFRNCAGLVRLELPSSLVSIGRYAFAGCASLYSIVIGDGVTIGDCAFSDCTSLYSIALPSDLTIIPSRCFSNCTALSSIIWPKSLTEIGEEAFNSCSFEGCGYTIELPSSVTTIGKAALRGDVHHIIMPSTSFISIGYLSFKADYTYFYVPSNMVDRYKLRTNWSDYADYIRPIEDYPVEPAIAGTIGQAVDLGLSVKWASWNMGASSPEECGAYIAWGETDVKWDYYWSNYKWCKGTENILTKYNTKSDYGFVDNKTTLDLDDDAAHVNWGGSWRMPTRDEMQELIDNCTLEWITENGVNGYRFTSKKDGFSSVSIFLPAAGYRLNSQPPTMTNISGWYLSSSNNPNQPKNNYLMQLNSSGVYMQPSGRNSGFTIRPVCD